MEPAVIITSHVKNTINSLPAEERAAIASALAAEMLLGNESGISALTPTQAMIYSMIRNYVVRDTARFNTIRTSAGQNNADSFCPRSGSSI